MQPHVLLIPASHTSICRVQHLTTPECLSELRTRRHSLLDVDLLSGQTVPSANQNREEKREALAGRLFNDAKVHANRVV